MAIPLADRLLTQQFLDSLPDAVLIVDRDGRLVVVNDKVLQLFVYRIEELLHQPVELLIPERYRIEHAGHQQSFFAHPFARPMGRGLDLYGRRSDGSEFPVEISISPMQADGQTLVSTIIRDVTERRQLDLTLRRQARELKDFIENSSIGLHWVAPDGTILWANQAELDLLGYASDEYIGHHIREFHADPESREGLLGSLTLGDELRNYSTRMIARDGSLRDVLIDTSVYREDGELVHTRCFTRDITSRRRTEAALREREEKLRLIFNSHQDIQTLIRVEPDGRFVNESFNQAQFDYARQFIPDPNEFLERGRDEFLRALPIPENEIQRAVAAWRDVAAKKTPMRYEPSYTVGPGQRREIGEITLVPILNRDGVCTHLLWTGHFITERRRAEEELRKRERELAEAQSIGHIGSWTWDVPADKLAWSDEMFRILGFQPQQFQPSFPAFLERIHPDERQSVERATWAAFEARTPHDIEHRIVRPDGVERVVHTRSVIQVDPAGKPLRVSGTIHDVTEEKQAAARETARLRRLKQLSELSMMLAGDPATVFERIVRMLGDLFEVRAVCLSEIVGQDLAFRAIYVNGEVISNAGVWPLKITPCSAVETNKDMIFLEGVQELFPQAPFLREHNAYSYCGFPALDSQGQVVAVLCLVDDKRHEYTEEDQQILRVIGQRIAAEFERGKSMAERARMEEELRENESRLEEAQHMAHLGSYTGDPETGRMEWSDELYRIYEVDPAQSLSLELVLARAHPDDRALIQKTNQDLARQVGRIGEIRRFDVEHRLLMPDGRIKYVLVQGTVSPGPDGRPRMRGTVQDITGRKHAEQERERLQAQLVQAQKLESIGRLAGGVAHDFNNLLTVINGYASLTLGKMPGTDPARKAVASIRQAGETAAGLVRQLLAFSRRQVLNPETVSLNGAVRNVENMLLRLIREDVEIVCELTPEPDLVMADRSQIEQVIINLAVNARDAMPHGGTLTIETRRCPHIQAWQECERILPPGDYVELIVRDTGTGMDDYTREHLFEPFFTTRETGKGTGLGLATVHGIVSQSGGCIGVESELGTGTVFYVYLPAAKSDAAEAMQAPAAEAAEGNETILLVEDKADVRRFTADLLHDLGYTVVEAEDGERALAICAAQPFDLLLTDVVMPRMSGVELAERVRSVQPQMKILLMSGYTDDAGERRRADAIAIPLLQKPFTPEGMAAKVREVLGPVRAAGTM